MATTTGFHSAFDYLEQLPGNQLKRLYQQPSTVLAIFRRMLPHTAKTLVMAMLYMRDPFIAADLDVWFRPDSKKEQDQAIHLLQRLDILGTDRDSRVLAYRLSEQFAKSLRLALTGGGNHQSFGVPCDTPEEERVDIESIDDFARSRWESILYFVVGSTAEGVQFGSNITEVAKNLLGLGGFVKSTGDRSSITEAGFTFLLQEVNAQVWIMLIKYLENADSLQMDNIELLSFLFTLGSLDVGQDYRTSNLSTTQRAMLDDLNDLGIVYRLKDQPDRYYPTRLATTLTSDSNPLSDSLAEEPGAASAAARFSASQRGYIIVETNYRVYAYTNSALRVAILSLFTRLSTQYPNMVTGKITKESIQSAINYGITSQQIISYLTTHAHPVMASHGRGTMQAGYGAPAQMPKPALPPTVVDQIRLWQLERDRMTTTSGFLFKEFSDQKLYHNIVKFADTIGVLVWKNDEKRVFFVSRQEQVSAYVKRLILELREAASAGVNGAGKN